MTERKYSLKQEILMKSKELGLRFDKKSGQCLLIDENIADFIITSASLDKNFDEILEIGPGLGVLTEKIVNNSKLITAIEKDPKFVKYLKSKFKQKSNFDIIFADAIKAEFPKHNKLISNVPYQISGPLLQKIICSENKAEELVLMFQWEFIDKMQAKPQPKNYGRTSILAQTYFNIEILKKIPPEVFFPPPKVMSGIIRLVRKVPFSPELEDPEIKLIYVEFLSGIFPYKNKTLLKALKLFTKKLAKYPEEFQDIKSSKYLKNFLKLTDSENTTINSILKPEDLNKRTWEFGAEEMGKIFLKLLNIN